MGITHKACLQCLLQDHGIDMSLFEMLWLDCIVHALDHHSLGSLVLGNRIVYGINPWRDGSTYDRVRAFMFTRLFIQEVISPVPWLSNRIADLAQGRSWVVPLPTMVVSFWKVLYASLSAIDPELATHLTGSIVY